jgi:hypothetical protein
VLAGTADLPATEAGRPSLEGVAPIEEGARGVASLLFGGTIEDILLVGEAVLLVGEAILAGGLDGAASLNSERLSLLIAEMGRDGGPMGLLGAKKLDLRLLVPGVSGRREMLSMVRSDSERREGRFFAPGVHGSWSSSWLSRASSS